MTDEFKTHEDAVAAKVAERAGARDEVSARRRRSQEHKQQEQSAKVRALYTGLEKIQKRRDVELPMMSKGLGVPFSVQIRDVTPEELYGSSMYPPTAATMMDAMLRESERVTAQAREKVGMDEIFYEIAQETFDNPDAAVVIAMQEVEDVLACIAVEDPDIRFVMHEAEAGGNRVWVRKLRREDISTIANAVWHNVEVDAGEAVPFPVSVDAAGPVGSDQADGAAPVADRVAGGSPHEV